jgi:hypothetical protein
VTGTNCSLKTTNTTVTGSWYSYTLRYERVYEYQDPVTVVLVVLSEQFVPVTYICKKL